MKDKKYFQSRHTKGFLHIHRAPSLCQPSLPLRRPLALQLPTAWCDSEEKGVFPDPILIYGCVYRTGLTNAFTATETKHQPQISIRMLHPHKDAGLRRKQSQGWSESVSWAERPENLWEEEVCRSGKITLITWSHVLDRQSDVSSKAIVPNLCNSKTEKLALESLSPSSPHPPPVGQGKLCVWWERTEGRGQVEKLFSARLREEEQGKAEGRQRRGPKGKRERGRDQGASWLGYMATRRERSLRRL